LPNSLKASVVLINLWLLSGDRLSDKVALSDALTGVVMTQIRISWTQGQVTATLKDTPTTHKLLKVLPTSANANTWGDEVYFRVPVSSELEADALQVVEPGTVGFWVEGQSLAIPFGPTPISVGDECRLAAKVNILGKLEDDPKLLKLVKAGDLITVELIN
jgi:uncharacterized protein